MNIVLYIELLFRFRYTYNIGNTAQSPPVGFAQHLLHNLCAVLPIIENKGNPHMPCGMLPALYRKETI